MYNEKVRRIFYAKYDKGQEGLRGALEFIKNYDEEEEDFMEIKGWEESFDKKLVDEAKDLFLKQGPSYLDRARWRCGMFDSVTSHFVIGTLVVKNTFVKGPPADISFCYSLKQQTESKYDCAQTRVRDWEICDGDDPQRVTLAWREKLNGSPMVTISGRIWSCHLSMPTSVLYAAEITSEGIYQLWPYGKLVDNGIDHELHVWNSYSQSFSSVREGLIMLGMDTKEYRIKRNPTIELENKHVNYPGVWEYELLPTGLKPIRPRTRLGAKNLSALAKVMLLEDLKVDPSLGLKISYREGYTVEYDNLCVSIPQYPQDREQEEATDTITVFGEKPRVYLKWMPLIGESIVGSKVVVEKDGRLHLFKDKDKKWDLIGGKVESGEGTLAALKRETTEEGWDMLEAPTLCGYTSSGYHHTAVYRVRTRDTLSIQFHEFNLGLTSVSWINRLMLQCKLFELGYKFDTSFAEDSFSFSSWGISASHYIVSHSELPRNTDIRLKKSFPGIKKILLHLIAKGSIKLENFLDIHRIIFDTAPTHFSSISIIEYMAYIAPLTQSYRKSWWDALNMKR